jgi:hypothetical protein
MSHNINIELLERAAEMVDYFVDKLPAQLIERDMEANDLESLAVHVAQAEAEASRQEMSAYDQVN